ncbi:NAD(P)H-hydrate epimerase [Aureliella helgolandensis]|uniref:NAD(P)H-hydrate epimerase n=1 Tax=Aureliella helgolandensis TaxID=2527968 RepID=A0A518G2G7_9BACT|nr:NAD(P)H-hydrate epimerase [Aureliella helgolandensis]QDV22739.1 Bifunctional NAD(P)H-hydrate repair enzyme Nnr [Aureliella helgolandensis]
MMSELSVRPLSAAEVRGIDRTAIEEYGMTGLVLMENAGRGAAERIHRRLAEATLPEEANSPAALKSADSPILILCGKGNNAGDGYVLARHLQLLGHSVEILQFADPRQLSGDAAANWSIATHAEIPARIVGPDSWDRLRHDLATAACVVDALLGTGGSGPLREPYATIVGMVNQLSVLKIAIDIPSGLDCDTGVALGNCFAADLTLTFVAEKIGFQLPSSKPWIGEVVVVPIGVPAKLLAGVIAA